MAQETLLSAARRAFRFYSIDMEKGGIITVETQRAMETLHKMVLWESRKPPPSDPVDPPDPPKPNAPAGGAMEKVAA